MVIYAHCLFLRNSCRALSHPLIPPYYPTLPTYIHYRARHSLPHYPTFLSHPTIPPSYPTLPISTIVLATLPTPLSHLLIPPSYPTLLSHPTIPLKLYPLSCLPLSLPHCPTFLSHPTIPPSFSNDTLHIRFTVVLLSI
jgi:hypothetical protein